MTERAGVHDINLIAAHLEGRLTADEEARFVQHLAECTECRSTLAIVARAAAAGGLAGTDAGAPTPRTPRVVSFSRVSKTIARPAVWLPLAATLVIATVTTVRLVRDPSASGKPDTSLARGESAVPVARDRAPEPARDAPAAPAPPTRALPDRTPDAGLLTRRSAERRVAGKTFRLVAGEWVDTAYDPISVLPSVNITTDEARTETLARVPALRPFAALGSRVVVVWNGTVYRFLK